MNVLICGAGEVGRYSAEVLGADGADVTLVDLDRARLTALDDRLDLRTLAGDATHAEVLLEAGCATADLVIAATHGDEVNLLAASIAKGLGARRCIARVHHSAYYAHRGLDYGKHLGIDHLVCPEHTTAMEIAQALRSPGALAVERFARGAIEMQHLPVSDDAPALDRPLAELDLPRSARLLVVERNGVAFIPTGQTILHRGDLITLMGESEGFDLVLRRFHTSANGRKSVILMGGSATAVWLCRALKGRSFSIRLLEPERARAEELSGKLDWVTVLHADATSPGVMEEERVEQAYAFVATSDDEERNILAAARAKGMGVRNAVAVLQRATYLHLIQHVGIDRAYSPRTSAVDQIKRLLDDRPVKKLAALAEGVADVFEVRATERARDVLERPLKDLRLPTGTIIAAIQRGEEAFVPGAEDSVRAGDSVVVISPSGNEKLLRRTFGAG